MANKSMADTMQLDRIKKQKIQLYHKSPFFAYLILRMNFREFTDEEIKMLGIARGMKATMAVDDFGNCYYSPDFLKELSDSELCGVLLHELLHVAFNHTSKDRVGNRDANIWNVSIDLNVNDILVENDYSLPKGGLIPENHRIMLNGGKVVIDGINKKSSEHIYDELMAKLPKKEANKMDGLGFDRHITTGKGKQLTEKEAKEIKENQKIWKELLVEASTFARQRGQLPLGVERQIGDLLEEKIDWKSRLYRYITNSLPQDYSWAKPSKRSISTGIYMPYMKKEEINVIVSIDTSGSIRQEELTEFVTEIVNLAKSFSNLKLYVIVCDAKIQETLEVTNGNIQKILELKVKVKGGGGTSVKPIIELIDNNYNDSKIWIHFTDGYLDEHDITGKPYNTIWAITKGGDNKVCEKNGGEIINLE